MRGTSPNGAYWWLQAKPRDAAIGRVLAPYRPGGCHGYCCHRHVYNTNKTQLLASNYRNFLLPKLSIFVTQKRPSTHIINATRFVTMWDATIQELAPYRPGGRHGHCCHCRVCNTNKTQLSASNYRTFSLAELSIFVTQKGPSTHIIDATRFLTMWDATIQEEALSYISSYQTFTADKKSIGY